MSDLRAKLAAAGDRETVELPGIGTVEVRSCRVSETLTYGRLLAGAVQQEGDAPEPSIAAAYAAMNAQGYLIAVTARDPETGALIFDPAASEEVAAGMNPENFRLLNQTAMRVCRLDTLTEPLAKNESRASDDSSIVSPAISTVLSKNSEDGSLHLSTVSG